MGAQLAWPASETSEAIQAPANSTKPTQRDEEPKPLSALHMSTNRGSCSSASNVWRSRLVGARRITCRPTQSPPNDNCGRWSLDWSHMGPGRPSATRRRMSNWRMTNCRGLTYIDGNNRHADRPVPRGSPHMQQQWPHRSQDGPSFQTHLCHFRARRRVRVTNARRQRCGMEHHERGTERRGTAKSDLS